MSSTPGPKGPAQPAASGPDGPKPAPVSPPPASPAGPARPAVRLPRVPLPSGRVVQGARRPGEPPPAPPPPSAAALPKLPRPEQAGPTPLPPAPAPESPELDALDVTIDEPEPGPRAGGAQQVPRRLAPKVSPFKLPAICTYGRFEILGRIAFGGMAEIFLGRESSQVGATRLLAIKRILPHVADDPQFVEMFLDEARLAIQLSHPHICHIYEFGEIDGTYFIAMEWIAGAQLGKVIRKARAHGGIQPEIAVRIIAHVADALHYAHNARDANGEPMGIVHRDVSPHNVMVSWDGQVKLLDFGIAKAQTHTTKTQTGVVKGKFSYMSPQQCLGKPIDARADVFALGVCLYEALTGEPLYHRPTEYETMRAVIEDPVPSIRDVRPDLPQELDDVVRKALQKEPRDRWQSAGEMQAALEEWIARAGRAVTTARIAEMMHALFEEQIAAGPLVDSTPFGASFSRRRPEQASSSDPGASSASARTDSGVERVGTPSIAPTVASSPRSIGTPAGAPAAPDLAARRRRIAVGVGTSALAAAALATIGVLAGSRPPSHPDRPTRVAATSAASAPSTDREPELRDPVPETRPPTSSDPGSVSDTATAAVGSPEPARGRLVVALGRAEGAVVRVGERTLGAEEIGAPIEIPPGRYVVHVESPTHRPWDREVDVAPGAELRIEPDLVPRERAPAAPPGRLSINTRPWSKVYVGSRLLGTTPIGEASVPSGTVRLRIVDRDGRTFTRTVRVAPGDTASVFFDLDE